MAAIVATGGDPTRVVGRRFFGALLESIIDLGVLATLFSLFGVKIAQGAAGTVTPEKVDGKFALVMVVYLVYVVVTKIITLGQFGWTPGMLFMSLRCVRSDGRPPGLWRAAVRTIFYTLFQQLQCIFLVAVWPPMVFSKTHRGIQDMIVGTFVIDGIYAGHLLIPEPGATGRVYVGPESVTRREAEKLQAELATRAGQPAGFQPPVLTAAMKSGQPFMDKNLDTYVVWNAKQETWLAFDKASNSWHRIG